ncbi:MAG: hypothetical protein AB7I59_29695 [Geminicoccaceae bacterium]
MRHPEPVLTRRGLMRASAALVCGPSARVEAAPSRPDVILTVGGHAAEEGFRFVNYRDRFPFWSPGWADVLAGRPIGSGTVPVETTLLAAFAPSAGAGRGRPRLLLLPGEIDPRVTRRAILIGLPAMDGDGLMVSVPGATVACGSSDVPMNPLDIAPTVCGLAGVPRSPAFVGRDYSALVPGARGRSDETEQGVG